MMKLPQAALRWKGYWQNKSQHWPRRVWRIFLDNMKWPHICSDVALPVNWRLKRSTVTGLTTYKEVTMNRILKIGMFCVGNDDGKYLTWQLCEVSFVQLPVKGAAHRFAATPLTVICPNDESNEAEIRACAQISATDNNETIWQHPGRAMELNGSSQLRSPYVRVGNRDPQI